MRGEIVTRRRPFRRLGWHLCALVVIGAYAVRFAGMRADNEAQANARKPDLGACTQYLSYLPRLELTWCHKTVAKY